MKAHCTLNFAHTLEACGLTYDRWRGLARRRGRSRKHPWSHATRQFIKRVQQVHSGKGRWVHGRYVFLRKEE